MHWTILRSLSLLSTPNNWTISRSISLVSTLNSGMRRSLQTSKLFSGFQWWSGRWNQIFNPSLNYSTVCPHPSSDQSGQAEHPLDWVFERGQQSILLPYHCQCKESDNGELESKDILTIEMKILPDLLSLLGLPWGWGGQHCLQVILTILWLPNRPL